MSSNQSGQALIEVLVALSVAAVVLGALVIATLFSISNAKFAENKIKATKLAQEGMEQMRLIRDRNYPVLDDVIPARFTNFEEVLLYNFADGRGFFRLVQANQQPALQTISNNAQSFELVGLSFKRVVIVQNEAANSKKITAEVSWQDFSGAHKSELQTILTKR